MTESASQDTPVSFKSYLDHIPTDTFEAAGKNFAAGTAIGSLFCWSVEYGSGLGAFCGITSLVHSATTPLFKDLIGDRAAYSDLTLTLIDSGRVVVDLTTSTCLMISATEIIGTAFLISMLVIIFDIYKKLIIEDGLLSQTQNGLFGNEDRNPCLFNIQEYFQKV